MKDDGDRDRLRHEYAWLSSILDELRTGNKVYGVVEAWDAIVALIQTERSKAALEARKEQIMQDELSLMFLTNDIGEDVFPNENLLTQWRIDQLAALKQGPTNAK